MKDLARPQHPYGPCWLRGLLLGAALGALGGLVESLLVTATGYNLALRFVLLVFFSDILAAALGGALVGLIFGGLFPRQQISRRGLQALFPVVLLGVLATLQGSAFLAARQSRPRLLPAAALWFLAAALLLLSLRRRLRGRKGAGAFSPAFYLLTALLVEFLLLFTVHLNLNLAAGGSAAAVVALDVAVLGSCAGLYLLLERLPGRRTISLRAALKTAALLMPGGLIVVLAAWTAVQPRFPWTAQSAAAGAAGEVRPNLILISLDTLRADHLGAYGYRRPTSPTLDRLAGEGVRFERALSPSAWTLPAHASLFTSLYPSQHGASQPATALPQELRTLAEILREEGYATAAFTGGGWVSKEFGFAQGFDLFDDGAEQRLNLGFQPLWQLIGLPPFRQETSFAHLIDKVSDWLHLRRLRERSFFLFIHTYEIHDYFYNEAEFEPYLEKMGFSFDAGLESVVAGPDRPGNNLIRWMLAADAGKLAYLEALYDAKIMFTDELLAELLAELRSLGLDGKTLVVITSDHGEGFDPARKRLHHGGRLHEDQIRVPLILWLPGTIPAATVQAGPAGLIDLMPTILDLLQLPVPREAAGRSLGISGGGAPEPRPLFGEELGYRLNREGLREAVTDDYRMVSGVSQGLKLIQSPGTEELYDLGRDAQERHNLAGSRSPAAALLGEQLRQFRQQNQPVYARRRPEEARQRLSRDTEEKLKSLGYIQ